MSGYKQTSVRLPVCALDALAVVAAKWKTSRDETVRQLLTTHVEQQEQLDAEDRLTHISTVLRYPPPPRWRSDPRSDKRLPFRAETELIDRARAVSLRLPGQSQRAYRDYQSRLLTDAVMTAIAAEEPFADKFLKGILPLLRHRAAVGLWRLAVAATSTEPERSIHYAAEEEQARESGAPSRLLLIAKALEKDVSWHAPGRFRIAASIARDMLGGANARDNERLLYEQGAAWDRQRQNLLDGGTDRDRYMLEIANNKYPYYGDNHHPLYPNDYTGRGGTAVWRAERKVSVQDFEEWLVKRLGVEQKVWPPGWKVRSPSTWHAHLLPRTATQPPQPYAAWAAEGRALVFPYQDRNAVWPLIPRHGQQGWEPVPGIEPIVGAARALKLRSEQVVGFIEAVLVDWGAETDDNSSFRITLDLFVDKARDFGLITGEEQRQAMERSRAATLQMMKNIINAAPEDQRPFLEWAEGDTHQFRRTAKRSGIKFRAAKTRWRWPGRSVANEILAGTRGDLVEWLAISAYKTHTSLLQHSMEEAWHEAFGNKRGYM